MIPAPNFSWDDIDALRCEVAVPEEDPAPGRSFTISEYAERYRLHETTAAHQLRKLAEAGKLREGRKPITNDYGRRIAVKCYWVPE